MMREKRDMSWGLMMGDKDSRYQANADDRNENDSDDVWPDPSGQCCLECLKKINWY